MDFKKHPKTRFTDIDELDEGTARKEEEALREGIDPVKLPSSWLLPHRDEPARCPRCHGGIEKAKVAGRSAY
ncbi:MAG: hypothetical protein JW993_07655 [Sedimentisphaerales bacterium]|nr:hypothetical protein [Sedimentisphaerales bacterium]